MIKPARIKIGIIVNERCQASSVFSAIDLIIAANYALKHYFSTEEPLFSYQLMGLTTKVEAYNGSEISSITRIQDCKRPDLVILPGAFESVLSSQHSQSLLTKMNRLFLTLEQWHKEGTTVASICTGNFILASSNIANGRALTCHWASAETARELFPYELFDTKQLLLDHGDIVSAGGAMAVTQLVLYLIARFHSRELALATAKLMMIEMNLDLQSRFAIFKPDKNHSDILVMKLQNHLEANFQSDVDLATFADQEGIGLRQLSRRFKKSTGETPLSYLQRFRVEQVKINLESNNKPISTLIWNAGYEDPTSFRRLFKRLTGLTMQEYRSRFSNR